LDTAPFDDRQCRRGRDAGDAHHQEEREGCVAATRMQSLPDFHDRDEEHRGDGDARPDQRVQLTAAVNPTDLSWRSPERQTLESAGIVY
jgi:hypothetical protein